jgi:hypothetical protein
VEINNILLSAFFAGLVAIFATVVIEKYGGIIGGIIGTVPTTIVPAAAFIWITDTNQSSFESSMGMVPVGMLLNSFFLWLWRFIPPKIPDWNFPIRLIVITTINLGFWFSGAAIVVILFSEVDPIFVGCFALGLGLIFGRWATRGFNPAPVGKNKVSLPMLVARGIAAALAIGFAVWLSQQGSPLLAGIASVFPAIFLTTMIALWISQGEEVPQGAVGPMMLGSMSVSLYALAATKLIPSFGVISGSIFSWLVSLLFISIPVTFYLFFPFFEEEPLS